MVTQADLSKANQLNVEYATIAGAKQLLDSGENINAMVIDGLTIDTSYMFAHVPSQMLDTIKQLMTTRQDEIAQELQGMGVQVTQPRAARKK